jgi:hypothetical protein
MHLPGLAMDFINTTPFAAAPYFLMDRNGAETLLIIVKGTWRTGDGGTLSVADEQAPVREAPVYHGDPGLSSLRYDTDIVLERPGTDCVLLGHAWTPKTGMSRVDVTFAVGTVRRTVRVFGERIWMKCLGVVSMSRPAPFEKIPLVYERAFGGSDTSCPETEYHEFCLNNPVGMGFIGRKSMKEIDGLRLPNLESPEQLIRRPKDRPSPAGFGPIAPNWQPRAAYGGTCDDRWRGNVSPLPPEDLDPRFYSSASPCLAAQGYLAGTERVLVTGASRSGRLDFGLPGLYPRVTVRRRRGEEEAHLYLDTLVVEPDGERLTLTWRGKYPVHGRLHELLSARVEAVIR